MADKNRDEELPHRVRGAARLSPAQSAPLSALSDELRHRMQAAVEAERAEARQRGHQQDQAAIPSQSSSAAAAAADDVTSAAVGHELGTGNGKSAVDEAPARGRRPLAAEPAVDDEVTEWLGHTAGPKAGRAQPTSKKPAVPRGQVAPPAPAPPTAPPKPRRRAHLTWLAVLAVAAVVTASLAVVSVRFFTRPQASSAAQLRQQAAARDRAAAWVARQVSRDVTVSCDQAMCRALSARGFPARDLLVLGPTSPEPDHSDVVVETAIVQGLFGSSLATAWAPDVLASFGSGAAAITVRVVARHGAASYQAALRADQADRKTAGAALLGDRRITMPAAARRQLAAGQVDPRLILAIASLAAARPVDIVRFGDPGPGADPSIPLRYADLAEDDQAAHMNGAAYVQAMRAALDKLTGPYRPASTVTMMAQAGEPAVLRVEFTAPSPLGLLGPQASP